MKLNYKIEYNHSLEEYKSKIKSFFDTHIKITLKEVQDFDKKFKAYTYDKKTKQFKYQYRLLNHKTWWFINGVFYEIPTKPISNR